MVPDACAHCEAPFEPAPLHPRSRPAIFQHAELPPLSLFVTEYRRHSRTCACCGKKTRAPLPEGIGGSPLGPNLQAAIAVMSNQFHLSRRQIPDLLHVLLGRRFSPATIQAVVERASTAVETAVEGIFSKLLRAGQALGNKKLATTCTDLRRQWPELWRFVDEEGVEPTNNEAERQLRPAVILRKLSAGTRSVAGMKAVGRLLTVVQTCKKQGRNAVDYLAEAIRRLKLGQSAPPLIYVN